MTPYNTNYVEKYIFIFLHKKFTQMKMIVTFVNVNEHKDVVFI